VISTRKKGRTRCSQKKKEKGKTTMRGRNTNSNSKKNGTARVGEKTPENLGLMAAGGRKGSFRS